MKNRRKNAKIIGMITVLAIIVTIAIVASVFTNLRSMVNLENDEIAKAMTSEEKQIGELSEAKAQAIPQADGEIRENSTTEGHELIWARTVGGSGNESINSAIETKDGGYLAAGYFTDSIDLGKDITLTSKGGQDGIIIKYDEYGRIERAKSLGGTGDDSIESIAETTDGGYIARGYFGSSFNIDDENILTNNGEIDAMIIKYTSEWEVEWVKTIGGNAADNITTIEETSDRGYIIGICFRSSNIVLENGDTINNHSQYADILLVKYSKDGEIEWTNSYGGQNHDAISTIEETTDKGYIIGGFIRDKDINLGNGVIISNISHQEGIIIKYNQEGIAQWARILVTGNLTDVVNDIEETKDKGCIVVGQFNSSNVTLENGIKFTNKNYNDQYNDSVIIKYDKNDKIEWAKQIAGAGDDVILSVKQTNDEGYIVKGCSNSNSVDIGDGKTLNCNGENDGIIIKYSESGEVQWAKAIGGNSTEDIGTIQQTSDGGYILGGYFQSATVNLEDKITLTNRGNSDGMIIKYGTPEYTTLTVHHYLEGTDQSISEDVVTQVQIAREYTTNKATDIPEYYELVKEPENKEETATRDEIIVTYYYKLKEYDYTVNYLEKDTNKVIREAKTGKATYNSNVLANNEIIEIDGYEYNTSDKESITIKTEANELNIYYTDKNLAYWADQISGNSENYIRKVEVTSDGGYIVIGNFKGNIQLENGETLTNKGNQDGFVIKYSRAKEIEWVKTIGGNLGESIASVLEVEDGYIITGNFSSANINLGNEITIKNSKNNNANGMIIKYNKEGIIQWAKVIEGTDWTSIHVLEKTRDEGFIITGECVTGKNIDLGNGIILNKCQGTILIKYNKEGVAQWAKQAKSSNNGTAAIISIVKSSSEEYITVGTFNSNTIDVGNGIILTNKKASTINWDANNHDAMIIKYNKEGETQWAKSIGSTNDDVLYTVAEIRDGGYLIGGCISGTITLENGETLNTNGGQDGIVAKYSKEGEIQWAKVIGSSGTDNIWSIKSTEDGGAIVAGTYSGSIDLGNGVTLNSNGGQDGMLIKYNSDGMAQWAKTIGGSGEETIYDIALMQNGGILAGGYFASNEIEFGNNVSLVHQGAIGNKNGLLVRYGIPEYADITVHYYKQGTQASVVPDETIQSEVGNPYRVKPSTQIPEYYEIVEEPENYTGTLAKEGVTVTYYYKLKEYNYTINYLEEGTNKVIKEAKIEKATYGTKILAQEEAIKIGGYNYNSIDKQEMTVGIEEAGNVINIYYTNANEAYIVAQRASEPKSGESVKVEKEITYNVKIKNEGTAPKEAIVTYTIPKGTTLVEGSVKVNGIVQEEKIETYTNKQEIQKVAINKDQTAEYNNEIEIADEKDEQTEVEETRQIKIQAKENQENILEYKVKVKEAKDGDKIVSKVSVDEQELEEIVHTVAKAVMQITKTAVTEHGGGVAIQGEKIIYTILIENIGGAEGTISINSTIPEGTTFVEESIQIANEQTDKTAQDIENGIQITIMPKEAVTIKYEVIVNTGKTGDIVSRATDEEGNTEETKMPVIIIEKIATIERKNPENQLGEDEVTAGDKINYEIRVRNTGTVPAKNIIITDKIPEGTVAEEIGESGTQEEGTITWEIPEIEEGETKTITYTAEVEYSKEEHKITSEGTANGVETEKIEYQYKKTTAEIESQIEIIGTDKVTSTETKVYYEINTKSEINYFKGKAKITTVATLPYQINEEESDIAEGKYDKDTNTITWNQTIEDIDTFTNWEAKEIEETKAISIKYNYENIDKITGSMELTVKNKIELQEQKQEEQYETISSKETEEKIEVKIEIPATVIVHHYIYDGGETKVKLTADETIGGNIGEEYETASSDKVPGSYTCINEDPENKSGKMTKDDIEVTYYYELAMPELTNTLENTVTASKKEVLTKENEEVTYKIKYTLQIDKYSGKATVKIEDKLPANIDIAKSSLAGGEYSEEKGTITWVETLEEINTKKGKYKKEIEKTIKIVYKDQNVIEDLVNMVTGETKVYYPEIHTTKPTEELKNITAQAQSTLKQEYKTKIKVIQEWDDNNNEKGRRPESIQITIKKSPDGEIIDVSELNKDNNWTYEKTDLPKYDLETGKKIIYEVTGAEINKGDLEYYDEPEIVTTEEITDTETNNIVTIKIEYKLLETNLKTKITTEGTKQITKSTQEVKYKINLTAQIQEYIGEGKTKIEVQLPYKIDEEKSELNDGKYDEKTQTITWEQELPHINTQTSKTSYKIDQTKQITVLYKDIDLTQEKMTSKVKGRIELYETEKKDEATASCETKINVNGKVTIKYVDKETGKTIDEKINYEITGKVGNPYKTEIKEIQYYDYEEAEGNTSGEIIEKEQQVIYKYKKQKISVLVKYQDKEGKDLQGSEITEGKEGDPYKTQAKEIENYRLLEIKGEPEGKLGKGRTEVIYIYEKIPAQVIVKYLEKESKRELATEKTIQGFVGEKYETERKAIENYKKAEPEPKNKEGKMTQEPITVIYYYERIPSGTLTVKYIDIDTEKEITYKEETQEEKSYKYEITGYVKDKYETQAKEIPYYTLVKTTGNTAGELTQNSETVIYYYKKKEFNISINQEIKRVIFNGEEKNINNKKAMKIEIVASTVNQSSLEITYEIKVRNTGEIDAVTKVVENIPQGYSIAAGTPSYWKTLTIGNKSSENKALETTVELKAGEEKTLEINLKWINSEENFGAGTTIAKILEATNPAEFEETTSDDNEAYVQIITSIKTGSADKIILATSTICLVFVACMLVYLYNTYNKKRGREVLKLKIENKKIVIRKEKIDKQLK